MFADSATFSGLHASYIYDTETIFFLVFVKLTLTPSIFLAVEADTVNLFD